jgi:hypothetical protein
MATTWIGSQAPGARGAFIQIGDAELRGYSRAHVAETLYWAFWSDRTRNFHPQFLFSVRPGDTISASLALGHRRWTLTIVDQTSGSNAQFSTSEDADAPFDEVEWTQEDARTLTGEPFPYPLLTMVHFSRLMVNSGAPSYPSLYSAWMSVNGVDWAPTPLNDDAFALRQVTVSSAGEQYLHIRALRSTIAQTFGAKLEQWTPKTPRVEITSASEQLIASLHTEIHALADARLPESTRSSIRLLIQKLDIIIEQARPPTDMSPAAFMHWRSSLIRDAGASLYAAHMLLRALRLPELP